MNSFRKKIIEKAQGKQPDRKQRNLFISEKIYERFVAKLPKGLTSSDVVEELMLYYIGEDEPQKPRG